jgi:asparagine synthase (glutamine-hydrolysing)
VFRLAKQNNVTVLLDGQGADEIMGGYEQYFSPYLKARAQMVSTGDVAAEKTTIEARYPAALLAGNDTWKGRVPMGLRWPLANLLGKGSDFLFGVSLDLAPSLARANQRQTDNRFNPLMAALKDDSLHAHLPTLLRYGDRNSMAHSRETRLPFCDHRLAEFVFSLSPETLMGNAETKRLLRGAMQNIMPVPIRTRWNKQGFRPPQEAWFSGALKQLAQGTFESGAFRQRGYWNTKWWQSAWARFNAGQEHLAWTLWKPIIAESWQTHFVDRLKSEPRVSVFN